MPLLPKDEDEVTAQIMETFAIINNAMLVRVWQELKYRIDVSRVTNVLTLKISEHSMKNLRLQAFRIYQMCCYILNSFWRIFNVNAPRLLEHPILRKILVEARAN